MTESDDRDMRTLIREMMTECEREIHEITNLKEHIEQIAIRLQLGTMPTLKETELLFDMRKAVMSNLSVLEAVKVKSNLKPNLR